MKKLILLGLLLTLSSCSLFGKKAPTTFEEYYARSITATIDSIADTSRSLGFFQSSQVSGILDGAASIPVLLSGSLSSNYVVKTDGRDSSFDMDNGILQYDSLAGSGFLSFDKISLMTESGDFYLLYKNIQDLGLSTPDMRDVFKKFENTWLSSTREESRAGITDPAELQAMTFVENLMKLDQEKVKEYLTTYPLWKSTEDMGMSGALHVYKVSLNRDKAFGLLNTLKTDLSGSGYTQEEQADIRTRLEDIEFSGTIAYHPEDASIVDVDMTLSYSGLTVGIVSLLREPTKTEIVFESVEEAITVKYTYTDGELRDDMSLIASQSGMELAQMMAYIDTADNRFQFSTDITAQGITVSLKHTQEKDGTFDGQLLLPVGSISWNGSIDNKKLTAFKLQGASPMGAMDLDLTASGEMIRGPFVLRVGGEEVMQALVGVIAEPERFRLSVDIPQSTEGSEMIHGELGLTMKRDSFSDEIDPPRSSTPLSELMNALEAIMPSEFSEDPSIDMTDSDIMLDEMDSLEPAQ